MGEVVRFRVRRGTLSKRTGHTYLSLETTDAEAESGEYIGTLDLHRLFPNLVNAKEVVIVVNEDES